MRSEKSGKGRKGDGLQKKSEMDKRKIGGMRLRGMMLTKGGKRIRRMNEDEICIGKNLHRKCD